MTTAGTTGYHYKLRNMIRKGLRGVFSDEKAIMVIAPDKSIHLSPDAQEANIAVCITALPIRRGSALEDGALLQDLQHYLQLVLEDSGVPPHADVGKYAGVERTNREHVTTLTIYASDSETLEHILSSGIERMWKQKVDKAFENYRRF